MIKIVKAEHLGQHRINLTFSDGKQGEYDMASLLSKETELTLPLKTPQNVSAFFLELGALCWKNGLELSPAALYRELQSKGKLSSEQQAA
ncbi:MAG: DUF2442 domain-containing protein [Thiobacillaceae bacterium]